MSTLGPGQRVWIGWGPDEQLEGRSDPRGCYGTIIEQDALSFDWWVACDGVGVGCVAERYIFPIDDGDETEHTERREEVSA